MIKRGTWKKREKYGEITLNCRKVFTLLKSRAISVEEDLREVMESSQKVRGEMPNSKLQKGVHSAQVQGNLGGGRPRRSPGVLAHRQGKDAEI